MNDLIELKDKFEVIVQSTEQYPIDFDDAWEWQGYARKDNALKTLQDNFDEDADYCTITRKELDSALKRNQVLEHGGDRRTEKYFLTKDCFKSFCMLAQTPKGKDVRRYYLKIEEAWNTPEMIRERAIQMGILQFTIPGSRRPALESVKTDLELIKIKVDEGKSRADLVLSQFVLENFQITGVEKHKISIKDAYKLYCVYAINPLTQEEFEENICFAYPAVCSWQGFLNGLKKIKLKQE
jgi:phage anti-repressor protein